MSNVEIKQAQINFWQLAVESFFIANYSMTKEEKYKEILADEMSHNYPFHDEKRCINRAKRTLNKLAGEISENRFGRTMFSPSEKEKWDATIEYMRKKRLVSNCFTIRSGKVTFSANTFECSAKIDLAPLMLKRWKSYKVN